MHSADLRNKVYTQSLLPDTEPPMAPPDKSLWRYIVVRLHSPSPVALTWW